MSSNWRPEGEPRIITDIDTGFSATLQYLRGASGVGAHTVRTDDDKTLTILPDSTTTARRRIGAVSVALGPNHSGLAAIIGELALVGATNLLLDGAPLFVAEARGRWVVELVREGRVEMRYLGEGVDGVADEG